MFIPTAQDKPMLVEVSIDNFRFGHTKSDVGASDLMKRDLIGLYLDSHSILYGFLSFVICQPLMVDLTDY